MADDFSHDIALTALLARLTPPPEPTQNPIVTDNDDHPDSRAATHSYKASITIDLRRQGPTTPFKEYLEYGQQAVPDLFDENVRRLELEHVKAFVRNLTDNKLRAALSKTLEVRGWTWEVLQEEASRLIIDD